MSDADCRAFPLPLLILLIVLSGCGITREAITPAERSREDAALLANQARAKFAVSPRAVTTVQQAYGLMRTAADGSGATEPGRYDSLAAAAHYATWLAYHVPGDQAHYAQQALVLCNTAILTDSQRVEGHYYRAIAVGLLAQARKSKGLAAMREVRRDAQRAIALAPEFDGGGPHRVLGGLYLRAPAPPTGMGSARRAMVHLRAALRIAPRHPENRLFLAEAHLRLRQPTETRALIAAALTEPVPAGDIEAGERRRRWVQLERELKGAAP